jgi:S1-C subfamily serine protease
MARTLSLLVITLFALSLFAAADGVRAAGSSVATPVAPERSLADRIAAVEKKLDKPPKDTWDKAQAVGGVVSAVFVAILGFWATHVYNRRQQAQAEARKDTELRLNQLQTVEKFLPHLSSTDERMKEGALLMISTLVGNEFASQLAAKFGGPGAGDALTKIASTAPRQAADAFDTALGELFASLRPSIVRVSVGDAYIANGFFVDRNGTVVTAAHVVGDGRKSIRVRTADGADLPATIQLLDEERDLAFLRPEGLRHAMPVSFAETETEVGMRIVALWESPRDGLAVRSGR